MKIREAGLRLLNALGALIGYGFLAAFLYLICLQSYRWFRDGEWTHISLNNGLHVALVWYGVREDDNNRFAEFMHWLEAPVNWLGVHKVFDVLPASLALFALSVAGNSLFIYCRDCLERPKRYTTP